MQDPAAFVPGGLPFPWRRLGFGLALAALFGAAVAFAVLRNLTAPESLLGRLIQLAGGWFIEAGLLPAALALAASLLTVRCALRAAGHGD